MKNEKKGQICSETFILMEMFILSIFFKERKDTGKENENGFGSAVLAKWKY